MATVELECTTCGTPLRIETFTGCQLVVEDWYCGMNDNRDDLCKKCWRKEIESLWSFEKADVRSLKSFESNEGDMDDGWVTYPLYVYCWRDGKV